jgi:predicted porin
VDVAQALAEVLNWGAGLEHALSPNLSAYLSYSTNKSGFTDDIERANLSALPMDIGSISAGTDFSIGSARFTLGLGYAWGRKVDEGLTDVLQEEDADFEATFVYRSIRVIFGFEIGID